MAGLGHDDVGLAEVGGRGVAKLVQSQPITVVGEQDPDAIVAQADPLGFPADVLEVSGHAAVRAGPVVVQEQRPAFTSDDQAGQQMGGIGALGDPHSVAALGGDLGLLVGQVQILDVQGEHGAGSARGLDRSGSVSLPYAP